MWRPQLFRINPGARSGGRRSALLLLLLVSLAADSCQALKRLGGGGAIDEANQLNQSAGEDIREIERIVQENKNKESEISRALNRGQVDAAQRMMDDSVRAIDRGMERGRSAAEKFEKAAKLDVDPDIKEYLSLRAQAVKRAIEAFEELRRGIISFRESTGSTDKAVKDKARNEVQEASATFDKLIGEAERLERQADEIARRNPEKIKPGR
jgi:hypothetical protein